VGRADLKELRKNNAVLQGAGEINHFDNKKEFSAPPAPVLTAERLREMLSYNPATGIFTRLIATSGSVHIGDIAGTFNSKGYRQIRVDRHQYLASRLAHLFMTGAFPKDQMDHINRVRSDDRWCNLRAVTCQNAANRAVARSA
jgi:HNH endonuclease